MTNEQKRINYANYVESRIPFDEPLLSYKEFVESLIADDSRIEDFQEKHPQYANERFEICDNGDVYVHGNCAYPIIIKNAVSKLEK